MNIFFDRVIVKLDDPINKTESGIILDFNSSYVTGIIVKVSEDLSENLKIGDRILAKKTFGTDMIIDGSNHRIYNSNHLLAKLDETTKII